MVWRRAWPALLLIGTAYYSGGDKHDYARIKDVPIQGFDLSEADPEEVNRLASYLNEIQALGERGSEWLAMQSPPRPYTPPVLSNVVDRVDE